MPELPEVETTRRGLAPHLVGRRVARVVLRRADLRWPISRGLRTGLQGQRIESLERRAKYILMRTAGGTAIWHLGMTGSMRMLDAPGAPGPHDHVDLEVRGGGVLRFNDPRRFGALLWTARDPARHPLLRELGVEPLSPEFDGALLHRLSRGRRAAVKAFIMDAKVVVGVGNIYASEALWRAGIHPRRAAGRISAARYDALAEAIRSVLEDALVAGGTTLRDYRRSDGEPGYFAVSLDVYGREGEACSRCGAELRAETIGQRNSFFCPGCQRSIAADGRSSTVRAVPSLEGTDSKSPGVEGGDGTRE